MTHHWVYRTPYEPKTGGGELYVGTRKNNGRMYESRVTTTCLLAEARVFNTKSAATNAGRAAGLKGEAIGVEVRLCPSS